MGKTGKAIISLIFVLSFLVFCFVVKNSLQEQKSITEAKQEYKKQSYVLRETNDLPIQTLPDSSSDAKAVQNFLHEALKSASNGTDISNGNFGSDSAYLAIKNVFMQSDHGSDQTKFSLVDENIVFNGSDSLPAGFGTIKIHEEAGSISTDVEYTIYVELTTDTRGEIVKTIMLGTVGAKQ